MRLYIEVQADERHDQGEPGAELAAFLSFCAMSGFGATHPLIALADRLHDVHRVPLGPFTIFYEAEPEDSEDRERLNQAWQPAAGIHAVCDGALEAIESDPQCKALVTRSGCIRLVEALGQLRAFLSPLDPGTPIRLTYSL